MAHTKLPVITNVVAQTVWGMTILADKKQYILDYMGEAFNTPEQKKIRDRITNSRSNSEIDIIVSNMMLKTEGMRIR